MTFRLLLTGLVAGSLVGVAQTFFYERLPGGAGDVGVSVYGHAWIVGTGAPGNDSKVFRWTGSSFVPDGGAKGANISVGPLGFPWVVTANGAIYRRDQSGWQLVPGRGRDIAVAGDGSVWLVGWVDQPYRPSWEPTLNAPVYLWTGDRWEVMGGSAYRISVDASGLPWTVSVKGEVSRLTGGTWIRLPGFGSDIACGGDGSVWLTGYSSDGLSDRVVYRWDGASWIPGIGKGFRLAVSPSGLPWVLGDNGGIYRMHELRSPVLKGTRTGISNGLFTVNFTTQPGVTYALRCKLDFDAPAWLTVQTVIGDGLNGALRDAGATGSQRIYRVDATAP